MNATDTTPRLLLTPRETALALATSERTLWSLTAPRGPISVVRFGRAVRYSIEALRDFIEQQQQKPIGRGTSERSESDRPVCLDGRVDE